jgi:predicted enzyme related to lactoylglutathione lyase
MRSTATARLPCTGSADEEEVMPSTLQPMIVTTDVERLHAFYGGVVGAVTADRTPADGPVFYLGLRIGESDLGLVSDAAVDGAPAGRILLSIEVPDVDAVLPDVERLGGAVTGGPTDMPWGQRVAHTTDPDGNVLNLTTTTTSD